MTILTRLLAAALSASSWTISRAAIVEAGAISTVTVESPLYDTRAGSGGGCDPAGCVGGLTRDGDLATLQSRWSCKPALGPAGSTCYITYGLADMLSISALEIAIYKGDERTRTMDIYVDGAFATSWTSSGTTADFETVELNMDGQTVEIRGVLDVSEWLSVMEVEILVDDGADLSAVEAGTLGTVTASAIWYDTNLSDANGCDPDGCTAALTRDGDLMDSSRWSCSPKLGGTCTIVYDLETVRDISQLRLVLYKGDERTRAMDIYVDGVIVTTWTSSGTTSGFETVEMGVPGQVIELHGILGDREWISIIEVEVMVTDGTILGTPTPESIPTPSPTTPQPVTAPTGDLQTVGVIPRARGPGSETDLEPYLAKDGDLSTSWACTGDPVDEEGSDTYYRCTLTFGLVYYRHIKQVKIALPDGDERQVDMRIASAYSEPPGEKFVTSSGTTKGLEVFDYDHFTSAIAISGIFATEGQSIKISEVEFVEEVRPDEVPVVRFSSTFDGDEVIGEDSAVDGFKWFSDSEEALGEQLSFSLGWFATVTAMELQFPVGDTYFFDLWIKNWAMYRDEPFAILTGFESANVEGWQTFDLGLDDDQIADTITLVMRGTGSGEPGFYMSNSRIIGSAARNPTDTFRVSSTYSMFWHGSRYPDFVAEGSGDQKAIMGAICGIKQASFDGVDCVGEDDAATGTVILPVAPLFVDGNIFMKSGVVLQGIFSDDDGYTTDIILEEGAAGKTGIGPIVVMDGVSNAHIEYLRIYGQYDPETNNSHPAVDGLGSTCLSMTYSQNITCEGIQIASCDGDGWVMQGSKAIDVIAGNFQEDYRGWPIVSNRGTGLVVDNCDDIRIRRYAVYNNGVAGIHITGSNNFFYEATIALDAAEGVGLVGSVDGQQPIEVIVESSSLVKFEDMKVLSTNDPVMTISDDSSAVSFNSCGFSNVETGTCVIQTEDPAAVTADDDELAFVGTCYFKV